MAEEYIDQNYKGKQSFCTKSYQSCNVILNLSVMMVIIILIVQIICFLA